MQIIDWLDSSSIPWKLTRAQLAEGFGRSKHPAYGWDIIEIGLPVPPLAGLISPLYVQDFSTFSPDFPATEFLGWTYFSDDAGLNIDRTASDLATKIGPAKITRQHNVLTGGWEQGRSKIKLTSWPRDWQSSNFERNPAHLREPRLAQGCLVTIQTGYLPTLSDLELGWIDHFRRLGQVATRIPDLPFEPDAPQGELEYLREPGNLALSRGQIGVSADCTGLIAYGDYLYVFDLQDVLCLELKRVLPAKGSGGSYLSVNCRTSYDSGAKTKFVTIASANDPDALTSLAESLASATKRPLIVPPHEYDA